MLSPEQLRQESERLQQQRQELKVLTAQSQKARAALKEANNRLMEKIAAIRKTLNKPDSVPQGGMLL